VAEPLLVVAGR